MLVFDGGGESGGTFCGERFEFMAPAYKTLAGTRLERYLCVEKGGGIPFLKVSDWLYVPLNYVVDWWSPDVSVILPDPYDSLYKRLELLYRLYCEGVEVKAFLENYDFGL
jgi:hypothetical protein